MPNMFHSTPMPCAPFWLRFTTDPGADAGGGDGQTQDTDPADGDGDGTDADGMDTDAGRRALDRLRAEIKALKDENKGLKPLAEKAKAAEDAEKSELQRLQEQFEATESEKARLLAERNRLKVAGAKGLPAFLADRLTGDTEEAMAEDADALLAALADYKGAKPPAPKPEDTGAGMSGPPEDFDPKKLAAAVRGR